MVLERNQTHEGQRGLTVYAANGPVRYKLGCRVGDASLLLRFH